MSADMAYLDADVCGFFFREPPQYDPPPELAEFLRRGPPPVYIGFGSIVIDDPNKLTTTILQAVKAVGVRAIVSRGWSNLGGGGPDEGDFEYDKENIQFIGDCPHDWLFQHVAAVIHHGGAGTTACGLLNGCPTAVVPFFGEYVYLFEPPSGSSSSDSFRTLSFRAHYQLVLTLLVQPAFLGCHGRRRRWGASTNSPTAVE